MSFFQENKLYEYSFFSLLKVIIFINHLKFHVFCLGCFMIYFFKILFIKIVEFYDYVFDKYTYN